ncbi:ferritin heavy chain-like [Daphnia pulex]|uniref:ferritin heavy chain-like n=1 Tax=Daphnia pulex TaxID=6669 RepID=UPI001EDD15D8|nr:ferritin heavy chain-like [Daphnia pulex]XP_046450553.1 ferritin heavy chain-like [Daphnia pulex]
MKSVIANFLFVLVAVVACARSAAAAKCSDHLLSMKADDFSEEDGGRYDHTACSASFSNFYKYTPQFQGLITEHISQSFIYSIMSSHFETDYENRLGFSKYLDGLSDNMWQQAISLIKYAGKRGTGVAPIDSSSGLSINNLSAGIKPWTEVEALALALDHHQMLALKVHQLHGSVKDAAFGDFLENQFVSEHVSRIRELSGHLTNLVPMVQEEVSKDLALYLFDQSLA